MADTGFYERPVLLDRERHRALRVRPGTGHAFARNVNSLVLAGAEFPEAAKEYAIVFTRPPAGGVVAVAMLGLRARENLYVDDQGRWDARYLPAFVRRYPFVLARIGAQEQMALCVDEACPLLGPDEGEPLFDAQGQETPFLRQAVEFLGQYQREARRTEAFCQRLDQAGLLQPMNARADLKDGRSFTVDGFWVVDEKKLQALPDATVLALFRAGEMHLVSLHLASLSNMQRLVDRMAQRPSPIVPPPQPA